MATEKQTNHFPNVLAVPALGVWVRVNIARNYLVPAVVSVYAFQGANSAFRHCWDGWDVQSRSSMEELFYCRIERLASPFDRLWADSFAETN